MILYNVTVNVDQDIELDWLSWVREEHVPKVMKTGRFFDHKLFKLLGTGDDGATYSIQYFARNISDLEIYLEKEAPELIKEHHDRYKDKHVAFRTVLQEVI